MASNKEIVEQIDKAFAANNVEGFFAHCAEDVEWTMVGDRTVKGIDAIRKWMAEMNAGAETPAFTPRQRIAEGDYVAAYGDMIMNGEPFAYCDIYRFSGGKVVELRSYVMKTVGAQQRESARAGAAS